MSARKTIQITQTAFLIVLVFISTVIFSLYIPETRGFFNIGEAGVYIAAFIGGPVIGCIAGGVGSMLADIYLGYYWYAPATLVIKGTEGLIVGFLSKKLKLKGKIGYTLGFILVLIGGFSLYALGNLFYLGESDVSVPILPGQSFSVELINLVWIIVSAIFIVSMLIFIIRDPSSSGLIISAMVGGMSMILGYFLYEQFILQYAAIVEVPFNVMQCLIGTLVSINVYKAFSRLRIREVIS